MTLHQEFYRYTSPGKRNNKHHTSGTKQQQVRYLPGLELRSCSLQQPLRVITTGQNRIYSQAAQHLTHFNLSDRLGSPSGIADESGNLLSRETWYPFGGTASWLTRAVTGAARKMMRYSGKERDASGLIYYGWRYYAPWKMRWLNGDPAGTIDGLNLFRMVDNNPVSLRDRDGRMDEFTEAFITALMTLDLPDMPPSLTLNMAVDAPEPAIQPLCGLSQPGPSGTHQSVNTNVIALITPPASHKCVHCQDECNTVSDLKSHMRLRHPGMTWRCDEPNCGKIFNFQSKLNEHKASHSAVKPFRCEYPSCDKSYKDRSGLNVHIKISHLNERPFICPSCGKTFNKRTNLRSHQIRCLPGDVAGQLKCCYCRVQFKSLSGRTRHMPKCPLKP